MAYDETVAARVRKALAKRKGVTERKMFGGIAFIVRGHLCCGVLKDELMLRVGVEQAETALRRNAATTRPMDFTGKPMKGMLFVLPAGMKTAAALQKWVDMAADFVATLPKKRK
jgi:TfoX/Sxy family transcriptional regulator of competence genes